MRSPLGILVYKLSLVMFLYSVCRVLFYAFNSGLFPGIDFPLFLMIMLGGLRFDLSAVLYFNLLYIIIFLLPFKFRENTRYQKGTDLLFYFTNAIGLLLNCIDFIYFRFTLRRTTVMIFSEFKNEQNYLPLAWHFFIDYFYIVLIWFILVILLVLLSGRIKIGRTLLSGSKYYIVHTVILLVFSGLMVIGLRSGLPPKQLFPLVPSDAGQYVRHPIDAAIVQNTPFCMLRTSRKPVFKRVDYFSETELNSIYNPVHQPDTARTFNKMNVVVLIVESLSRESLGCYNRTLDSGNYKGYTPFLDSLANHALVFTNSFANGHLSIDASPSCLASIPSLQESFTESFYANNSFMSLASCLSEKGYDRMYAHGGANGSIGLNAFASVAGFNKYIGKDEYNNNDDYDGVWGIWDHKFLPFYARECSKLKEPFLSSIFTVSSHDPFKLPSDLEGQFASGPMTIYKSIRYADYSLRLFFKEAARQPWFGNTIFVITGDHTSGRFHDEYKTSLGAFGVPLIFYTPGKQITPRSDDRVAQQIDIMPTILNYLGYDKPWFAFGKNLFSDHEDRIAVNYLGNTFQLIWDDWVIQHNTVTIVGLYNRIRDPLLKNNLTGKKDSVQNRMENKVKAIIKHYNNRMIDNRLIPK